MLTERGHELKPEVQHQMYGAINEIDMFLRTIDHFRQKEVESDLKNIVLYGPETKMLYGTKKSILQKLKEMPRKHLGKLAFKKSEKKIETHNQNKPNL